MLILRINKSFAVLSIVCFVLLSCSVQKQIAKSAKVLLTDSATAKAHIGISIYEPATNKFWYGFQSDKYFVPASNTKIMTCYADMKHLGDSLVAIRYIENDTAIYLLPTGDPTLLHAAYKKQPVIDFLQKSKKKIYINDNNWKDEALGSGWEWDDYNDSYTVERSALPVYNNSIKWIQTQTMEILDGVNEQPVPSVFSEPEVSWEVNFDADSKDSTFFVKRKRDTNSYTIFQGKETAAEQQVPFVTYGIQTALELLKDTTGKEIKLKKNVSSDSPIRTIHSQPLDSLLKPMMYESDNFFAEQSLLMVSNQVLGYMNDRKIVDSLLKTDFKDLPQKPYWADGSGLSHYNLFTPQDFVFILNKMKNEFGMSRLQSIFPTGGTGTLSSYYKADSSFIFAKTGTLSGVIALSGFLYTKKNKLLIFSVLVNNHKNVSVDVRRAIERFVTGLRRKY